MMVTEFEPRASRRALREAAEIDTASVPETFRAAPAAPACAMARPSNSRRVITGTLAAVAVVTSGLTVVAAPKQDAAPQAEAQTQTFEMERPVARASRSTARTELPTFTDFPSTERVISAASATLTQAELVSAETVTATPEQAAAIADTTAVVRELMRRAALGPDADTTEVPQVVAEAADAALAAAREQVIADQASDVVETAPTATETADGSDAAGSAADLVDAIDEAAAADQAEFDAVLAAALDATTAHLAELLTEAETAPISADPRPKTAEEILAEEQAAAAIQAAIMAERAAEAAQYGNGQIPVELLCSISYSPNDHLRCDAEAAFERLNAAFAANFGRNIKINDSYRSYNDQVAMKRMRGYLAATPGTSNHGLGLALDLGSGIGSFGTPEYRWMAANAPAFGFTNPDYVRNVLGEAWHWEYQG